LIRESERRGRPAAANPSHPLRWSKVDPLAVPPVPPLLAAPLAAEAQQPTKIARIGYLALNPAAYPQLYEAFRHGLRDLDYVRRLPAARGDGFVPNLCLTQAHSRSFQGTPAHVAVGSFSFGGKQLRILTRTVI
jgi:hypothetical protein